MAMTIPMIEITTSNSIKDTPRTVRGRADTQCFIEIPLGLFPLAINPATL
jgi:hypothetical protein